jgi:hypothetical protein
VGAIGATGGGRLVLLALAALAAAELILAIGLLFRWSAAVPWAVAFAGAGCFATRHGGGVHPWAAFAGALLLLAAELAAWSIEHDARVRAERGLVARRAVATTAIAGVSLVVGLLVLAAASVSTSTSLVAAGLGVVAAVGVVVVVLRLVRSI